MSFNKEVWDTLTAVNCEGVIDKKGKLSYISWANAWTMLMNEYPDSSFEFHEPVVYSGTYEVSVTVTIKDGDKETSRLMTLPVMDYKNNAILNPDSRDISDARMRCLVKCLALFGLGLFLYRGEDLPDAKKSTTRPEPATEEQRDKLVEFDKNGHVPQRWVVWLENSANWDGMTHAHATSIILDCEKKASLMTKETENE